MKKEKAEELEKRIHEMEEQLDQHPELWPPEHLNMIGGMVVGRGGDPGIGYAMLLMGVKRYIKAVAYEAEKGMGPAMDQYLEKFGHKKHLVRALQLGLEINAPALIHGGELDKEQAIQYHQKMEKLLEE